MNEKEVAKKLSEWRTISDLQSLTDFLCSKEEHMLFVSPAIAKMYGGNEAMVFGVLIDRFIKKDKLETQWKAITDKFIARESFLTNAECQLALNNLEKGGWIERRFDAFHTETSYYAINYEKLLGVY